MSVWIAGKIVSEAKGLLQDRNRSVKEIGYTLGFAEAAHFSAYFKKHTELSPADYRRQLGKGR